MQAFTKTEIEWMIALLETEARSHTIEGDNPVASLHRLRAEQYQQMADKLRKTLVGYSKRIEVKYKGE